MHKIAKYMKSSTLPILAIVVLLVIQAFCDLSLPQYTSDIVNVGIQQGGITSSSPDVIRASQFERVLLLTKEEEQDIITRNYTLISKDSLSDQEYKDYLKSYPVLETEDLYLLQMDQDEDIELLNRVMGKGLLMVSNLGSDTEEAVNIQNQIKANLPPETAEMDLFTIFGMMPKEELNSMLVNMDEQLKDMPESIIEQSAIVSIKAEYQAIGINTDRLQTSYILIAGLKMLGLAFGAMVVSIIVSYLASKVAAALGQNLRSKVFEKVVRFSNSEYDKFSTASLITRSTNDIQQVQMLMVMLFRMVLYAPILGVGGVLKVLNTETSMAWIIAVAVLAMLVLVGVLFGVAMPKFKLMQKLVDRLNLVMREILTGLSVIRAFSTEKYEEERFDKANVDLTKTNLFVNRAMTFMMPLMMLIMNAITVLIVWQGAKGIDVGNMQVGDLMAFIQYAMQIIMSFLMIAMLSIILPRASVSAKRINEVLDTEITIHDPESAEIFVESRNGYVEFNNVSFRYPNADEDVLSNITFTAKPGETTAIIGSTGSGKSTLINLIPRFFDVTEGEIKLNGVNIKNVSQHDLREEIGYVPQKGVLFSGNIDSNLRYGKHDATESEIEKAAKIAQAYDFIQEKPDKYESEIAQGGNNVSGGQKQRLSIARAIAKDPQFYIFDDSFSALDYKTDVTLRKALKEEITDSTILIVAQRISTIINAEQIIVLDDGVIAGIGTHKELLKNCETYQQIALSQLSKEELENE